MWRQQFGWDWLPDLADLTRRLVDSGRFGAAEGTGTFPPLNIFEKGDRFLLTLEVPGVSLEDIDLSVTADTLTIEGERKPPEVDEECYHRRERRFGHFKRSVTLPDRVRPDGITATLKAGVLTVEFPKAEPVKPQQIRVAIG